jgi:hypothetical protein
MKWFLSSAILSIAFLINTAFAENTPGLTLGSGLWEGISETNGTNYYLLQLNDNGEHKLFIANLASAFRYVKQMPFDNNDINCTPSECIISVPYPSEQNTNLRLIVTPNSSDSFKVLEMYIDDQNKPRLAATYQLDKKNGKSTVREFIERYRERLIALEEKFSNELYGVWIGVADIRGKKQLVVLNYKLDEQSEFVLMINGSDLINKTHFNKSNVSLVDGVTQISTTHTTFANQIILHQLATSMLQGHLYSYHKGQALEPADFKLYRVKK